MCCTKKEIAEGTWNPQSEGVKAEQKKLQNVQGMFPFLNRPLKVEQLPSNRFWNYLGSATYLFALLFRTSCSLFSSVVTMDIGDETTAQGAEVPVEAVAPVVSKLSLKVLEIAKDCQNQNGLRHGDYHQYRQYCTRRLKRVRSSRDVRFMFGKGKSFVPKVSQSLVRSVVA